MSPGLIWAQEEQPLFASDELVEMSLKLDVQAVLDDRGDDADYHDVLLTYTDENGQEVELEAKVRTRGKFRRDEETCNFPPLRINFPKKKVENTLFHGQDKLKMVTHCQEDEYILREYLVYRIYGLLTPYCFRVRLARIQYVDTGGNYPPETHYAFFIEDEDLLAERCGGQELDEEVVVRAEEADPEITRLMYVFQYMIGNKDFDVLLRRNMKVVQVEGREKPLPVPYDFDWAEVVDASYTQIAGLSKKARLNKRVFRKLCVSEEEIQATFARFEAVKPQVFELIKNFELLDKASRKEMIKYFKEFYALIRKPKIVEAHFLKYCN
ncbi:MAG: hypothetical protein D6730_17440 [Bacteroidetes bacterium]|nr:MAG: hypothetical protein D6730_17440 [Bacteroidota bacterium]